MIIRFTHICFFVSFSIEPFSKSDIIFLELIKKRIIQINMAKKFSFYSWDL